MQQNYRYNENMFLNPVEKNFAVNKQIVPQT